MPRLPVLGAIFALSCANAPEPSAAGETKRYEPLVAFDDWRAVEASADPFIARYAAPPSCAASGARAEPDQAWLELDTTACGWISVTAPARGEVQLDQDLRIKVSHFDLDAPEPAEAELRLRLGDCDAWSKTIPIPSAADVAEEAFFSLVR